MEQSTASNLELDRVLMIKAAFWPVEEASGYWQQWKQYRSVDEAGLLQESDLLPKVFDPLDYESQAILSQVYRNLQSIGDPLLQRFRGYYQHTRLKSELNWQLFRQVVGALQDQGLEPLWTQGSALRTGFYAESGGRRLPDAAFCVRAQHQDLVAQTLETIGLETDAVVGPNISQTWQNARKATVISQRNLLPAFIRPSDETFFWQQAERVTLADGSQALLLKPTHQIFCNLVWAYWQAPRPHVRQIADCVVIARTHPIDWADVLQLAQLHNYTYIVTEGIRLLNTCFAIQLTKQETHLLGQSRVSSYQRQYHQFLQQYAGQRLSLSKRSRRILLEYAAYGKYKRLALAAQILKKGLTLSMRKVAGFRLLPNRLFKKHNPLNGQHQ